MLDLREETLNQYALMIFTIYFTFLSFIAMLYRSDSVLWVDCYIGIQESENFIISN